MKLRQWFHHLWDLYGPARRLRVIEQDSLPARMPLRDLVMTKDDGDAWSVGMLCPCRCGSMIELLVIPGAKPRWDVDIDKKGRPSLKPSVWRQSGCRSHFWLRNGRVFWCE